MDSVYWVLMSGPRQQWRGIMTEIPYGTTNPEYKVNINHGRRVRISNLAIRDRFALIGPGGLTNVTQKENIADTYRVPGIESINVSQRVSTDALIIHVSDEEAASRVVEWVANYLKAVYEARLAREDQLVTSGRR